MTWASVLSSASYVLPNGGLPAMIWMYLVTLVGFGCAIFCMAEMASMAPTSGGQVRVLFFLFFFFLFFWILFFSCVSCSLFSFLFVFLWGFSFLLDMNLLIKVKEEANMMKFSIIGM